MSGDILDIYCLDIYDSFENIFEIKHKFITYLKESCLVPYQHVPFKKFLNNALGKNILTKMCTKGIHWLFLKILNGMGNKWQFLNAKSLLLYNFSVYFPMIMQSQTGGR